MQWSQEHFNGLTPLEHAVNNTWFEAMFELALKDDGILYVPALDKSFNKDGQEIFSVIQGGKS